MAFGVLSTGFSKKTRQDIIDEINASLLEDISPNLNLTSTSIIGQIVGIIADQLSQDWDVLNDAYDSQYPDSAASTSLDNVSSITGTTRLAATASTTTLIVTGDNATVLTVGRQARVPAGGTFETDAGVTINTATAWAGSTAYSLGDLRQNDSPANIYLCVTAGTSAASGGPTGTGTAITDGTVVWRFVGIGAGYNTVASTATETGEIVAQIYQITEIVTAVSGWKGVNNLADATTGTEIETDPALRERREDRLAAGGNATIEAIRAALLEVLNVADAFVFENTTDVTDANGLPPHSVQATVVGGTDADIAQTVFEKKAAGIETYGTDISEVIVDSQGTNHTINADRADLMEIWVDITVITNGDYPTDGDTQVATVLAAQGNELTIGEDVIFKQMEAAALESCGGVSGVVDIQSFYMDKQPVSVLAGNTETYTLVNGQTLTVRVDGQATAQTVTFNTADFADINNATAAEVAAVITTDLTSPSATGGTSGGAPVITSDSGGSVLVTGGSANGALGFPTSHTPTGTSNIAISSRQISDFDTSRIAVASV
jgi:uncharacterized phage protein gp47/JayE